MNALSAISMDIETPPLVDVLTSQSGSKVIGYRIGGFNPGPSVFVAGHDPVAAIVYDRLMQLPTLSWMRGSLNLIFLNAIEHAGIDAHIGQMTDDKPDELVFLPYFVDEKHHADAANEGYWTVLRACKSIGMIAGRGVQPHLPETSIK